MQSRSDVQHGSEDANQEAEVHKPVAGHDGSGRESTWGPVRSSRARGKAYEFGLLDPLAKREIRRATLKAICIPGYQVPFASRELPIARGFGTGGLQLTFSLIGEKDVLKVIDQGTDASVNACSIRKLVGKVCPGVETTEDSSQATLIQTRHRIPETPLAEKQILVFQVPYPCPLVLVESNEGRRVRMHGEADYSKIYVKLYEDIVQFDEITLSHRYPVAVHTHYVMDPSPIPRWDVPKLHQACCLNLFGAGREKKIYAVPPYTNVEPLEFDDVKFRVEDFAEAGHRRACTKCGSTSSFLDELIRPGGIRVWACSDTDFCQRRQTRLVEVPEQAFEPEVMEDRS
jgi:alpha-D-ribose 1-methylphosphonate 5-phosphate C-P lyase